jgi:hypothetical protein
MGFVLGWVSDDRAPPQNRKEKIEADGAMRNR